MTAPRRPCAVDLGSGTCGFVAATLETGARVPRVSFAEPLPVDVKNTTACAEAILTLISAHGCDCLVVEVGHLFDAGAATVAIGEALAVCREILGALRLELRRKGVEVHQINRRSWSSRLVPGIKGGITNAMAAEAAVDGLDEASAEHFRGDRRQHMRDALGALRGWMLREEAAEAKAVRAAKPKAPRLDTSGVAGAAGRRNRSRKYRAPKGERKIRKNAADRERMAKAREAARPKPPVVPEAPVVLAPWLSGAAPVLPRRPPGR